MCVFVCECTQKCILSVHNGSAWCAHNAPAESSRALLLNREREGKNKGGLRALQSRRMTFRALGVQSSLSAFVLPSLNIINNISSHKKKKGWGASRISTPLISLCRWFFFYPLPLSFMHVLLYCAVVLFKISNFVLSSVKTQIKTWKERCAAVLKQSNSTFYLHFILTILNHRSASRIPHISC